MVSCSTSDAGCYFHWFNNTEIIMKNGGRRPVKLPHIFLISCHQVSYQKNPANSQKPRSSIAACRSFSVDVLFITTVLQVYQEYRYTLRRYSALPMLSTQTQYNDFYSFCYDYVRPFVCRSYVHRI